MQFPDDDFSGSTKVQLNNLWHKTYSPNMRINNTF